MDHNISAEIQWSLKDRRQHRVVYSQIRAGFFRYRAERAYIGDAKQRITRRLNQNQTRSIGDSLRGLQLRLSYQRSERKCSDAT